VCWILSRAFSESIDRIMWLLFMCCIRFIDLYMLNYQCIPGMKLTCSWCMIFLVYYWILFVDNLCVYFH
jgi:hypothetical protein